MDTLALAAAFLISILSPMAAIALGFGPMKTIPAFCQRHGKRLALRQEAVAWMHGLGARGAAGVDDLVDDEIGLGRGRRADGDGLVRHFHVQGIAVGIRIDGNRLDAQLPRGLDDAAGDLATVGDQDLLEHTPPSGGGWSGVWPHAGAMIGEFARQGRGWRAVFLVSVPKMVTVALRPDRNPERG